MSQDESKRPEMEDHDRHTDHGEGDSASADAGSGAENASHQDFVLVGELKDGPVDPASLSTSSLLEETPGDAPDSPADPPPLTLSVGGGDGDSATASSRKETAVPSPSGSDRPTKKLRKTRPYARLDRGPAETAFQGLSHIGPLLLLVLAFVPVTAMLAGHGPVFGFLDFTVQDVYARFAEGLRGGDRTLLFSGGLAWASSLFPHVDGAGALPSLMGPLPFYYDMIYALQSLTGMSVPHALQWGAVGWGGLFLLTVWFLARATGHDRSTALAAGFLCLCSVPLLVSSSLPRMGIYFFLLTVSLSGMACFYRTWRKDSAPLWRLLGYVLTGIAILNGGLLFFVLPLGGNIVYLTLRGTPARVAYKDGVPGFALMLILLAAWLVWIIFGPGLGIQLSAAVEALQRSVTGEGMRGGQPWWSMGVVLLFLSLPWLLLVLFVNWWQAVRALPQAWRNRVTGSGPLWLFLVLLTCLALGIGFPAYEELFLLGCVPPLAVLGARALMGLSARRSRWFFGVIGALSVMLALCLLAVEFRTVLQPYFNGMPQAATMTTALEAAGFLNGLVMAAPFLILGLLLLFLARRSFAGGCLLLTCLFMLATSQLYAFAGKHEPFPYARSGADRLMTPEPADRDALEVPSGLPASPDMPDLSGQAGQAPIPPEVPAEQLPLTETPPEEIIPPSALPEEELTEPQGMRGTPPSGSEFPPLEESPLGPQPVPPSVPQPEEPLLPPTEIPAVEPPDNIADAPSGTGSAVGEDRAVSI